MEDLNITQEVTEEVNTDDGAYILLEGNKSLDDTVAYEEGLGEPDEVSAKEAPTEEAAVKEEELDLSVFDSEEDVKPEEAQTEEKEATPEYKKFKEDFKKNLGIELEDALAAVQELQNIRAELYVQKIEREIQDSWGVDTRTFNERMAAVRDYAANIAKTKPELFKKLDNPEGVKLIWAKIEQERGLTSQKQKTVPSLQRNTQRIPEGALPKYDYTYSQIQAMSRADYEKNAGRIAQAFATGRVDMKR